MGRNDEDGATCDSDEVGRDAAQERRLDRPPSTRADDDQLGGFVVGQVCQTVAREAQQDPSLDVADVLLVEKALEDCLTGGEKRIDRYARQLIRGLPDSGRGSGSWTTVATISRMSNSSASRAACRSASRAC